MFVLKVLLVLFLFLYMYIGSILWDKMQELESFVKLPAVSKVFWYIAAPFIAIFLYIVCYVNPQYFTSITKRMYEMRRELDSQNDEGDDDTYY